MLPADTPEEILFDHNLHISIMGNFWHAHVRTGAAIPVPFAKESTHRKQCQLLHPSEAHAFANLLVNSTFIGHIFHDSSEHNRLPLTFLRRWSKIYRWALLTLATEVAPFRPTFWGLDADHLSEFLAKLHRNFFLKKKSMYSSHRDTYLVL